MHPALLSSVDDAAVVTLHNLGSDPVTVRLRLPEGGEVERLLDLLTDGEVKVTDNRVLVPLNGFGFRWLRVTRRANRRLV